MKSPEVYSQLRSVLEPWFKSAEFKQTKELLGWSRPHGEAHTVVWFQISRDGWDCYAGSKFVVEFQRSPEPKVGSGGRFTRRQRLAYFLSQEEREEVRVIQNGIIARLPRPPSNYPKLNVSQQVTDWYLAQFKPISEPYPERHDIWLRYASPEHVTKWADFIISKLPKFISVVESWAGNLQTGGASVSSA
jgi:hypothetical protein